MTLPSVSGWLIDYYTAQALFESGSNARIAHCVTLCATSDLHICHHEEALFKAHPALRGPFITDQNCILFPTKETRQQCLNVAANPKCKRLFSGNQAAIVLTAIASCEHYGVISDHRSPVFTTVFDLCTHFGIPVLSADEYFGLL